MALNGDDYWLFLKDETRYPPEKNIRVTSSKNLTKGYAPVSKPISGDYWTEGPTVLKNGNGLIKGFDPLG